MADFLAENNFFCTFAADFYEPKTKQL